MKIPTAVSGFVLALIAICPIVRAYERHLSAEAIQDAYNLGRKNDEDTKSFLAQYFRRFTTPNKGPYIASIELLTPYAQLVSTAMLDMLNENVFDVQRKYASHASVVLRVRAYSTPSDMLPSREEDTWKDFRIRVSQENILKPDRKSLKHRYPRHGAFDYIDMELEFDARNVASAPITIEVTALDGQHVETSFDLSKLK